ncbi:MAG: hypothetical protein RLZZ326_3445 [Planctomycetota bacterium]
MQKQQDDPRIKNIDSSGAVAAFIRFAKSKDQKKALVEKIVIGPSPGNDADQEWTQKSLADLSEVDWSTFPKLTHLYLWSLGELTALKPLPARLQCLDVRGCAKLERLPALPASIETLVTDGCAALVNAGPHPLDLRALTDLSMKDCPELKPAFVYFVIEKARNLRLLDISGSPSLPRLPEWPPQIEVARFKGCSAIEHLPDIKRTGWPKKLRRLDLSGTAITSMPPLSATLDHVDLSGLKGPGLGTTDLWPRRADVEKPRPRTLYLHGSGLLVPPVSEQGEDSEDNVARRFRGFHDDIEIVGRAESRRCKILLVGNGHAGKTTLAFALRGLDPNHGLGSTHGIRLYPYQTPGDAETKRLIWDFGGQEIYHNAHRIFIQAGTVFVVVWNPLAPPTAKAGRGAIFEDVRRPPRYWIDMIRMACPNARIALVCNPFTEDAAKKANATADLVASESQLREQARTELGEDLDHVTFHLCNARDTTTISGIATWIDKAVSEVVASQGTAVPAHWKVGEAMVQGWVERLLGSPAHSDSAESSADATGPAAPAAAAIAIPDLPPQVMTAADFAIRLTAEIKQKSTLSPEAGFDQLLQALEAGTLALTTDPVDGRPNDQVRRTLDFLTHTGLLYWNPQALRNQVIVDQKWFLDGVYAVLQRPHSEEVENEVFTELSSDPVFTRQRLAELVWDRPGSTPRYTVDEQDLLLAFMERIGLCFPLVHGDRAWSGVTSFISVQHLQSDADKPVSPGFNARFPRKENFTLGERRIDALHVGLWERALAKLGSIFGRDGRYAEDVVFIERNKDNRAILVRCTIDPSGIGGTLDVRVSGPDPRDLEAERKQCDELLGQLAELCDQKTSKSKRDAITRESALGGGRSEAPRVFVSYAWNPKTAEERAFFTETDNLPEGYEQPVESLRAELESRSVSLWFDKTAFKHPETRLNEYLNRSELADVVLVCHSDRYWTRPYCMCELKTAVYRVLMTPARAPSIVFVGLSEHDALQKAFLLKPYIQRWRMMDPLGDVIPISADLLKPYEAEAFRHDVANFLENHLQLKLQAMNARCLDKLTTASSGRIADWFVKHHVRLREKAAETDASHGEE